MTRKPSRARVTPEAVTAPLSDHRKCTELEAWVAKRLNLRDLFAGLTTTEMRRDRLRVVLLERELAEVIAGKFDGKAFTWRRLFARLYDTELTT